LTALLGVICAANGYAGQRDSELRVLQKSDRPRLHQHLLDEVSAQYDQRRQAVAQALMSSDAMRQRREQLRSHYREMLGPLPQRTPLNARTVGTVQCDGYRIEKVIYESRPRHHVTANLYLPDPLEGAVPGVLVPCGHSANGKANEAYQSVCILLARNGCAALIYDPIGQGERNQILDLDRHGTTEHTVVGAGALLVGWNTANYRVWDGLRSMDYLASRAEVDPQRLGCTGNSGGGTMTTWLMAVDDRIAAAAPSCFVTTVQRVFNTIGPQDCEQHFPGQGAFGIEHTDFITMRAPKPTIILAAEQDFFDIGGTRTAFADAEAVYRVLGHPQRVGLFSYNDEHGFSRPRREAAVAWMRRWLADDDRSVSEPEPALQRDEDLQVTESGQVLRQFDDEQSVVDFANGRAAELARSRQTTWKAMSTPARVAAIKRLLGLPNELDLRSETTSHGTITRDGYTIEKLVIARPNQVPLPALLAVPNGAASGNRKLPAVLYVDARGKAADAQPGGPVEKLVEQGHVVLSVDLRGYGETADNDKDRYHNDEFRTAMLSFHIGQPLVGQRVEDLLAALAVLNAHPRVDPKSVHLVGIDRAGPVALHAAAIEPRLHAVTLRDSIRSWANDVVAKPLGPNHLGLVVPGALVHYDLPDLEAMLGNRLTEEGQP
jgi:cephalosporin-C deacetylase-like acetyl esterase